MDVLILSSSPRLFGSMAYASTGSGNVSGGNVIGSDLSPSVSLVSVSFSLATAPRSPALISATGAAVLPWSKFKMSQPLRGILRSCCAPWSRT